MKTTDASPAAPFVEGLNRYAHQIHRLAGEKHHVASPLGAWLLVAICAPLARGNARDEMVRMLGVEPEQAAEFAGFLLERPHPLVNSGAAIWSRPGIDNPDFQSWIASLPRDIETGDLPGQAVLDIWADEKTMGLIKRFPIQVTPNVVLLMATALATKVSWARPFTLAPGTTLGPTSPWSRKLDQVLESPYGPEHIQFIAETERAGRVAVHTARAIGGLQVTSVIAAPEVPALDVLAAAHQIATFEAVDPGGVKRCSLFDLPIGEDQLWTVTAEEVSSTHSPNGREERFQSILPAWSADSQFDLGVEELGFPAVAEAIAGVLRIDRYEYEAKQAAVARYTKVGFEAAAVSAIAIAMSAGRPGVRRVGELRFGHPYAAVAVTVDEDHGDGQRSPWHGLPVFSAWVAEPDEAGD